MWNPFDALLELFEQLGCIILDAIIDAINLVIVALGAVVSAAVSVIPIDMPELPEFPEPLETAASWVAWVFPVATAIAALTFVLSAWLMWQGLSILLRWVKAI